MTIKTTQYNDFNAGLIRGKQEMFKQIKRMVLNWDIEPCCHGLRQQEFLNKLNELYKEQDRRYKLNQADLNKIYLLRKEGYSKHKIAEMMNVSISTIVYWTNKDFRDNQRNKIRKKVNRYLPKFKKRLVPIDEEEMAK